MQHKVYLEYTRDANGNAGFILDGVHDERVDASTMGKLIAHDILEHMTQPSAIGTMTDELLAFGAILYTRGHEYSAVSIGQGDILSLFETWTWDRDEELDRPDFEACDEDGEEVISTAMRALRRALWRAVPYHQDTTLAHIAGFARRTELLLRQGWNLAQSRYGTRSEANALFHAIERAVDATVEEHGNTVEYWLGMSVEYDTETQRATATIDQEYDGGLEDE